MMWSISKTSPSLRYSPQYAHRPCCHFSRHPTLLFTRGWSLRRCAKSDQIAIVGTGLAVYLLVALDGNRCVLFEHISVLGLTCPTSSLIYGPILPTNPSSAFVGMSVSCPGPELAGEPVVAAGVPVFGHHCPIVVGPAHNHWVEMVNQRCLWGCLVVPYDLSKLCRMSFDRWLTGFDEGLETKRSSIWGLCRVDSPHWILPDAHA